MRRRYDSDKQRSTAFRLAGMETYERLHDVAGFALDLLSTYYDLRLSQLVQGLQSALSPFTQIYQEVQQGAACLRDIAYILEPATPPRSADCVASQLRSYLDTVRDRSDFPPALTTFGAHLDKVSRSYWPGLFHCYEIPGLPRTNNELESRFRDTSRRLLRTTGQQALTQRTLRRQGAWELLPCPSTEAELLHALPHTLPEDLAQEGSALPSIVGGLPCRADRVAKLKLNLLNRDGGGQRYRLHAQGDISDTVRRAIPDARSSSTSGLNDFFNCVLKNGSSKVDTSHN